MKKKFVPGVVLMAALLFQQCNQKPKTTEKPIAPDVTPVNTMERALELSRQFLIVDGHIDLPDRLRTHREDITKETKKGEFDFPRAKKGGLDAPFMSIYVPAWLENNGAKSYAIQQIELVERLVNEHPQHFAMAFSADDVRRNFEEGIISLPMGMENGAPLEGDLDNLDFFYQRGIRYITLTHSKDNHICDASYDTRRTWDGLSPFGYEVVKAMNRIGMIIDVSHLSDSAFYQVMRVTRAPVIASHSSCRYFTPGLERNMSDDMIREVAEGNGVVMINFGSFFLSAALNKAWKEIEEWVRNHGRKLSDPEAKAYIEEIAAEQDLYGDISLVVDHINHVVEVAGIDHVGFGSDFDGVMGVLPEGLKDASHYPDLIRLLLEEGYSEEDIEKICYKNLFRVWDEVASIANTHAGIRRQ